MPAPVDYNRVLYPGAAHAQTHPDRLATLATIHGVQPAPLGRCRVLEIGCTDGGNLIPMAHGLPGAEFIGIDVSTRSLAVGRDCIAALGLNNVRLLECDILETPPDFGAFDYIIAHGVYSWVPPVVREKMLAICRAHLAPQGVAYISYNAYPGGHFRELVRGMMLYHVRNIDDPEEKRRHAKALLRFVVDAQPKPELFATVVGTELQLIEESSPAALYHDDLSEVRTPFHFHEFAADAARHGLQFLSEANISEMQEHAFSPNVAKALDRMAGDRIAREQYLDFLRGRRFRQTLLCHREVALSEPRAESVRGFFISSRAKPVSAAPALDDSTEEEFLTAEGAALKTANSLAKAIVLHLAQIAPRSAAFGDLMTAARSELGEKGAAFAGDEVASEFAEALLSMYSAGVVELHVHSPSLTLEVSERPVASPVARWCVQRGARMITNLLHRGIRSDDPIAAQLMLLLDGTRDRAALAQELAAFCLSRGIKLLQADGTPAADLPEAHAIIASGLEENLQKLARMAVLVA